MNDDNPVIRVFRTGAPDIVEYVELHQNTWSKIQRKHDARITMDVIEQGLTDPCKIVASTTNPEGAVCFINERLRTSEGAELRIPVKVLTKPGVMVSAHFSDPDGQGPVIRRRQDG